MRRTIPLLALALLTSAVSAQTPVTGRDLENLPIVNPHAGPIVRDTTSALPLRSVREEAALTPAFRRDLATGTLVFRSRTGDVGGVQEPVFVVDGVRRLGGPMGTGTTSLLGATVAPFGAVGRVDALGGFVPASIGEAGGGIVRVTTEAGAERFGGRVEGLSSEATDAYGSSLASATARAPFGRVGGVSITGEAARRGDAVPSAGRSLRLSDAAVDLLQTSPQSVFVTDPTGATRSVPFPADAALTAAAAGRPFTQTDLIAALGLAPGSQVGSTQSALGAAALADVERVRAQDDPLRDLALSGQALFFLPAQGRLRLGGQVGRREMAATAPTPAEAFGRRFANRGGLYAQTSDRAGAFAAVDGAMLPGGVEASLRASVETTGSVLHPAAFSSAIEDALLYGDIDGVAGVVAQRYFTLAGTRYLQLYGSDGGARPADRPVTGFAQPGAQASLYDRQSASSTQVAGSLGRTVGANRIEIGGEVELQTFRRITLDGRRLAAFVADGDGGQGTAGFPNGVTRYDQLDFEVLRPVVQTYGYSFNGLGRTSSEDVDGYFVDQNGRRANTDVAPFRPLTAAGYLRDVVRVGPATIDAGLRIERYDARATTLFDPYAPTPILRAGDVQNAPTGIGDDFAVYQTFSPNGGQTVGFRDREGRFYDVAGNLSTTEAIIRDLRGSPVSLPDAPRSDAYAKTEASIRLQPRVQVTVQATPTVAVSGYAARLSRRPDPSLYVPFAAYEELTGATVLPGNAALTPEDVRAAGLGVDVQATPLLSVGVHGFTRQTRGLPALRQFAGGFPSYVGVAGDGGRNETGIDLTARLARTRGVTVAAGYTLAFATDLDVQLGGTAFGPVVLGSQPSAGDTRHALDLAVDARVPAGRLRGLGAGVVVAAQSGRPYRALAPNTGFSVFDPFTSNVADVARLPWTSQVDLRLDYRFGAGPVGVTAFVWAENVLGTRNVLAVYRATGEPDADGFPATPAGQSVLTAAGDRLLYEAYTGGPVNVGGVQSTDAPFVYGGPRQIRVGLVLGR